MANRNTTDAASKANEQTISTTENKKRMPTRKDGRCFRNTSDGYKMAIAPRRGMKPMKNQTSEGNCNHRDNHSAETMCHTKHDKNARKILGLCAGYVWLESITTQCRLTPRLRDAGSKTQVWSRAVHPAFPPADGSPADWLLLRQTCIAFAVYSLARGLSSWEPQSMRSSRFLGCVRASQAMTTWGSLDSHGGVRIRSTRSSPVPTVLMARLNCTQRPKIWDEPALWSFVIFMRLANAKVSDGSQPPGASASPLGVPAGARSLDRLVRLPSSVPGEAPDAQVCQ
jgi:hypothetical protein